MTRSEGKIFISMKISSDLVCFLLESSNTCIYQKVRGLSLHDGSSSVIHSLCFVLFVF